MSDQQDQFKHFHFTLGPVQGFVAQARRTRDFWAGSFILSWLAAVAAKAVLCQHADNKILFPEVDAGFLGWLEGKSTGDKPTQGAVPNRFKAQVNTETFDPSAVVKSVRQAWKALADKVWEHDLANVANVATKTVWDRQIRDTDDIESFWEMAWALTDRASDDSSILDRRKNWRSHFPPDEPCVKCMMMDGWQELSGATSPTLPDGDQLTTFWKKVRGQGHIGLKSDLRPKEHLCAIGFVKRRFVRWFDEVDTDMPGGWRLKGWELAPGTPSAPFMAAVHWLEDTLKRTAQDIDIERHFLRFHQAAHELVAKDYGEWDSRISCLEEQPGPRPWRALDGDLFFEASLDNENIYGDKDDPQRHKELRHKASNAKAKLKALQSALDAAAPTPFYAVLMMDGDSLGEHMSDTDKQTIITKALSSFTGAVKGIVEQRNGFLIYAGGDDVLAVLPLEDAMDCALDLRRRYQADFAAQTGDGKLPRNKHFAATLSGAIEYAHIRMPLTKILKDAHNLLDGVAKDKRGRDALAVRVWKPGGKALEWAMPWERALEVDPHRPGEKRLVLARLARELHEDDNGGEISSGFFYRIRERFDLLNPYDEPEAGGCASTTEAQRKPKSKSKTKRQETNQQRELVFDPEQDDDVNLMAVDYYASGLCDKNYPPVQRMIHARAVVRPLLEQCRPVTREAGKEPDQWISDVKLYADGALLVRFLANKGVER